MKQRTEFGHGELFEWKKHQTSNQLLMAGWNKHVTHPPRPLPPPEGEKFHYRSAEDARPDYVPPKRTAAQMGEFQKLIHSKDEVRDLVRVFEVSPEDELHIHGASPHTYRAKNWHYSTEFTAKYRPINDEFHSQNKILHPAANHPVYRFLADKKLREMKEAGDKDERFKNIDEDNDGYLDKEEMAKAFAGENQDEVGRNRAVADEVRRVADVNCDGVISKDEFNRVMEEAQENGDAPQQMFTYEDFLRSRMRKGGLFG